MWQRKVKPNALSLALMTGLLVAGVALYASLVLAQTPPETSARQKEHAKLYHYHTGKNLPNLAASGTGDIEVGALTIGDAGLPPGKYPLYPRILLVEAAFRADLIAVGVTKSSASALTEDQDFIFTDWQLSLEQVLKNNPAAPVGENSEITVTRPGGTLVVNGRNIRAIEGAFLPFHQGERYLLFLYYMPATGAYRAVNDLAFELLPNAVQTLRPNHPFVNTKTKEDPQAFIGEVRDAVAAARERYQH